MIRALQYSGKPVRKFELLGTDRLATDSFMLNYDRISIINIFKCEISTFSISSIAVNNLKQIPTVFFKVFPLLLSQLVQFVRHLPYLLFLSIRKKCKILLLIEKSKDQTKIQCTNKNFLLYIFGCNIKISRGCQILALVLYDHFLLLYLPISIPLDRFLNTTGLRETLSRCIVPFVYSQLSNTRSTYPTFTTPFFSHSLHFLLSTWHTPI